MTTAVTLIIAALLGGTHHMAGHRMITGQACAPNTAPANGLLPTVACRGGVETVRVASFQRSVYNPNVSRRVRRVVMRSGVTIDWFRTVNGAGPLDVGVLFDNTESWHLA
jgi:hypothetical protein